jgi:hypothetical protein
MKHEDIDHTGLTGAGGSVATDAIWDAAGDLAVGSGANTAARLAIGASNGMVLQRASGALAWGYPPFRGCKVYNSATQTMNGSGTNSGNTVLTFDSEDYDTDTMHDTGSNTQNITIPITGKWAVGCMVWGTPLATGTLVDVLVGGAGIRGGRAVAPFFSGIASTWIISTVANLTATNVLTLQVNNPNAGTFPVGHASAGVVQTTFWAHFLGV